MTLGRSITVSTGMTDISEERTIVMDQILNLTELVEWSSFGSTGLIVPKPGKFQQVNSSALQLRMLVTDKGVNSLVRLSFVSGSFSKVVFSPNERE